MISRIVGSNQVATPPDQMGTPPDIGKTQMGTPPEPIKSQIQADGSVAPQLQQSALQRAGDQRLQASLLQTELLTKLTAPPEPDSERLMNSIKESGPGDERVIKANVDAFLPHIAKAFDPQPEPPLRPRPQSMNSTNQTAELKEKGLWGSDGGVENPTTLPDLQNKLK